MTNIILKARNSDLEIAAVLESTSFEYHFATPEGASAVSAFRVRDFDAVPVVDPIVLPTGKNAVVAIGNNVYRKSGAGYDVWFTYKGIKRSTAVLTEKANAKADSFRVVFEGE